MNPKVERYYNYVLKSLIDRTSIIPTRIGRQINIKGADDTNWWSASHFFRFMDPVNGSDTLRQFNEFLKNTYGVDESECAFVSELYIKRVKEHTKQLKKDLGLHWNYLSNYLK